MKLWKLTKTEYYGQCTGFDRFETLVVVFEKKPNLQTLAPFLEGLSGEMGEAISEGLKLINIGNLELSCHDYELDYFETGKNLTLD
jgi:Lon protease-like protein